MKERQNKAYDPENLSIRAFRLDSAASDSEERSTDNSSPGSSGRSEREQALAEMRDQWGAFT